MEIIIQLLGGAIGGNIAGGLLKNLSLGTLGNSLVGILGGGLGGQILSALGVLSGGDGGGSLDLASIATNLATSGTGGAVLMGIIGLLKKVFSKG